MAIAVETCKQLSLGTNVYDSERLIGGSMSGSDVRDFIEAADGFAEVFPEHKYQVVAMLQERGHLTAMTGDGVSECLPLHGGYSLILIISFAYLRRCAVFEES